MLVAEVLGLKYHRTIRKNITTADTQELKAQFDYSFAVCYGDFNDESYEIVNKKSCILDLRSGIDAIISRFNRTSRNEYHRSERTEGLVFFNGYDNFDEYYNFYSTCEQERRWLPVPPDEIRNSLVFTASFEGKMISGMSCYHDDTSLRVGRIYSRKRSELKSTLTNTLFGSAAKRIVVEICKYGIQNGYTTLDLGGVDISENIKSGITQFKLSLGGDVVDVKLGRFMTQRFQDSLATIKTKGWDIT